LKNKIITYWILICITIYMLKPQSHQ
jgi:hypothetical protein